MQQQILISESDGWIYRLLLQILSPSRFSVIRAPGLVAVHELVRTRRGSFNLVFCELSDSDSDDWEALCHIREMAGAVPVIPIVSEQGDVSATAFSFGFDNCLFKPCSTEGLIAMIEKCLGQDINEDRLFQPRLVHEESPPSGHLAGLIGRSVQMQRVCSLIKKVAPSEVNVLVTGESGTGKEMVASAIHKCSSRRNKPFIAINCAAIPKDLLESELFGHAKGAFTGATAARRGLFEEAHEGTILLDEIGDLPLPLQAKILRLLQTKQVKPLGQNTIKEVDVRIISATHKNLKLLIQRGEFREDLYYRLNVMPIHLPPLRERKDDIPALAEHFLRKYAGAISPRVRGFSRSAMGKLINLPWKGNVRELENAVERAMVLAEGELIEEVDILVEELDGGELCMTESFFNSGMTLKDIEREYIKYVLGKTGNKKETATRILGIDRKTLYRKERQYGLKPSMIDLM